MSCGFTSYSTQNRSFRTRSSSNLLAPNGKTKHNTTLEMWANAQRDGCPAKYSWHPLFNAAKCGWRPLLECHAVTLPRRKTHWNSQVCLKLTNRLYYSNFIMQGKINRGRHRPSGWAQLYLDQPVPTSIIPHFLTGRMPFLPPNQQRQSTEGN